MLKRIAKIAGIDAAIGYTVLARIIQAGGGLILIALISLFLSKEEQGYYYTFGSIVAIQIFFELGLNTIITQYVAHEAVHLQWISPTQLSGDPVHVSRLSSLLHFCLRAFSILCLLLFVILQGAGVIFFDHYGLSNDVAWRFPWQLVASSTALMLWMNPLLAFLEGLGKVKEVARIRLVQQITNTVVIALVLTGQGGLLALGLGSLAAFVSVLVLMLTPTNRNILLTIYRQGGTSQVEYWKEIFPYQYKIALSWISGYFIFQLFNPVVFATDGPVAAGQMGMTWAALNGISALSMSWINTKVPLFSGLVAQKNFDELDRVFGKTTRQLLLINVFLISVFAGFLVIVNQFHWSLAERFLPAFPASLLMLTVIANQLIFSWATYLRSHKQEPYLLNSIVGAILIAASTILLGRAFGLMGIVSGYTLLTLAIGLPWSYFVFNRKRKEWHAPNLAYTTHH